MGMKTLKTGQNARVKDTGAVVTLLTRYQKGSLYAGQLNEGTFLVLQSNGQRSIVRISKLEAM